ncbi:MAG: NAD(P)H-hydrate dehydratase [Clostridia bacterium]|nr:NAD(P)H-hydrate dehydratase [Clostridia bacterium]
MKVCTVSEMRNADKIASENFGIPSIVLMENAAISCVSEVIGFDSFTVLCGKGNNAGDGFAIARHLINRGKKVKIYTLFGEEFSGDCKINFDILKNISVPFCKTDLEILKTDIMLSDCVIDAVFGTGLKGEIDVKTAEIFDIVNEFSNYVLSVDVPSGIDGDSGNVLKNAIKADKTVTFAAYKKGLLLYPAADFTGEIKVSDISIPKTVLSNIKIEVTDDETAKSLMPKRQENSYKGDYGKILIIGGSVGMAGAVCLSAKSAFKAGAGLVKACVPHEINDIVQKNVIEAMTESVDFEKDKTRIAELINGYDAVLFGNGIGREAFADELLEEILKTAKIPIVIDADGLFALSKKPELLKLCGENAVLTPHTMEMARLLGVSADEVEKSRFELSKEFATKNRLTLVLKGNHTIITAPDGTQRVNMTGNSGMATAGSGDALAGILAGLLPVCKNGFDAATLSVYLHGKAGDFAAQQLGKTSLTAGDIVEAISHILPVEI